MNISRESWECPRNPNRQILRLSHHCRQDDVKLNMPRTECTRETYGCSCYRDEDHLHVRNVEVGYVFRGLDELKEDIIAMIEKEGFIYEG